MEVSKIYKRKRNMKVIIKHRYNVVDEVREPRSVVSQTIPNQAPDLRYIIQQVSNGNPVSVLEMRGDKDATMDDVDLRLESQKHFTSSTIDVMLSHIDVQRDESLKEINFSQKSEISESSIPEKNEGA